MKSTEGFMLVSLAKLVPTSFHTIVIFIVMTVMTQVFSTTPLSINQPVSEIKIILPTTAVPVHQVDARFLSVALDSYGLYLWWKRINLE